jgi:hypothetical protein
VVGLGARDACDHVKRAIDTYWRVHERLEQETRDRGAAPARRLANQERQ